jgi:hypothetical protein
MLVPLSFFGSVPTFSGNAGCYGSESDAVSVEARPSNRSVGVVSNIVSHRDCGGLPPALAAVPDAVLDTPHLQAPPAETLAQSLVE